MSWADRVVPLHETFPHLYSRIFPPEVSRIIRETAKELRGKATTEELSDEIHWRILRAMGSTGETFQL